MATINPTQLPEDAAPELRRWTLAEFIRLDELGFFPEGEHWELLDGAPVKKPGQNEPHLRALMLSAAALRQAFGQGFTVECQIPLHLVADAPEPDVLVLRGTASQLARRHVGAAEVALVVEVADSRLDTAKGPKVEIYAKHGMCEYWILDLGSRSLEVRRGPRSATRDWTELRIYTESESVVPIGLESAISVADLLPLTE